MTEQCTSSTSNINNISPQTTCNGTQQSSNFDQVVCKSEPLNFFSDFEMPIDHSNKTSESNNWMNRDTLDSRIGNPVPNPQDINLHVPSLSSYREFLGIMPTPARYMHLENALRAGVYGGVSQGMGQSLMNSFPMNPSILDKSYTDGHTTPVSNTSSSSNNSSYQYSNQQISTNSSPGSSSSSLENSRGGAFPSEVSSPERMSSGLASSVSSLGEREFQEPSRPYACTLCNKRYTLKNALDRHTRFHVDGPSTNSCNICEEKFCSKGSLQNHLLLHNDEKPFACPECDKRFRLRSYLDAHIRTHTKEKPFSCDTCFKCFAQRSSLATHIRTHTGNKPYSCEICCKPFAVKHYLTVHMRSHSGEKPFDCPLCSKKFTQKSSLTIHTRLHTGVKPYECDMCEKKFIAKSYLESHLKTHNIVKDFMCKFCGKGFKQRSSMFVHMRKHTNPEEND